METDSIVQSLKARRAALVKELGCIEKALAALTPDAAPAKKPPAKTIPGVPAQPLTLASVVMACQGEFCNAEKVALRLGTTDTTKVSGLLSKAFAMGKLEREGERGSYEYQAPTISTDPRGPAERQLTMPGGDA
jgi:hypothetical protein